METNSGVSAANETDRMGQATDPVVEGCVKDFKDPLPIHASLTQSERYPSGCVTRRSSLPSKGLEASAEELEREGCL